MEASGRFSIDVSELWIRSEEINPVLSEASRNWGDNGTQPGSLPRDLGEWACDTPQTQ